MYRIVSTVNSNVYLKVAKKVDLISSHHTQKITVTIWVMNVWTFHNIYIYQLITLYILKFTECSMSIISQQNKFWGGCRNTNLLKFYIKHAEFPKS